MSDSRRKEPLEEITGSTFRAVRRKAESAAAPIPALTILGHPNITRVGEQARLTGLASGEEVELNRLSPGFAPTSDPKDTHPLADRYVSRQPIVLALLPDGGIRVSPSEGGTDVLLDGEDLDGPVHLSEARVGKGVVLVLSDRVALLLHKLPPRQAKLPSFGLVGHHVSVHELRQDIVQIADLDVPVLLRGETGTGKELVARAIHDAGSRASKPWISVNMSTIPSSLGASELFGHTKGAFTGATDGHKGHFSAAHRGTLFLDEIGDTPLDVQAMLLRVLETKEVQPLGSSRVEQVDVRLVAATDMNLERANREGTFRLPLLHRLSGYQIYLPTLRDRREDIGRLFYHFLGEQLESMGRLDVLEESDDDPFVPGALVDRLVRYSWPGNVRQLSNVVQQLAISSRAHDRLRMDHKLELLLAEEEVEAEQEREVDPPTTESQKPAEIEEDQLVEVLRAQRWRIGPSAKALGISRASLYNLVDRSDRVRRGKDLSEDEIRKSHASCSGDLDKMVDELEVSKNALKVRVRLLELE